MSSLSEICADPVRTPTKKTRPLTDQPVTDAQVTLFNKVESLVCDGYTLEAAVKHVGANLNDYLKLRRLLVCSTKEAFSDYSKLELFRSPDLKKSGRHRNQTTGQKCGNRWNRKPKA
jgi:hypothetical protein